jgi:hypothetical protein
MLTIPRDTYLALVGMRSSTLDQRVRVGEAAWAFGVTERPAHGEYFHIDGAATILSNMLSRTCGLTLKQSAEAVREHGREPGSGWLELVTKAERWQGKIPRDRSHAGHRRRSLPAPTLAPVPHPARRDPQDHRRNRRLSLFFRLRFDCPRARCTEGKCQKCRHPIARETDDCEGRAWLRRVAARDRGLPTARRYARRP